MNKKQKRDYLEAFRGVVNHLEGHIKKQTKQPLYKVLKIVALSFLVIGAVVGGISLLISVNSEGSAAWGWAFISIGGMGVFGAGILLIIVYGLLRWTRR
jgi:hypothetical protein